MSNIYVIELYYLYKNRYRPAERVFVEEANIDSALQYMINRNKLVIHDNGSSHDKYYFRDQYDDGPFKIMIGKQITIELGKVYTDDEWYAGISMISNPISYFEFLEKKKDPKALD